MYVRGRHARRQGCRQRCCHADCRHADCRHACTARRMAGALAVHRAVQAPRIRGAERSLAANRSLARSGRQTPMWRRCLSACSTPCRCDAIPLLRTANEVEAADQRRIDQLLSKRGTESKQADRKTETKKRHSSRKGEMPFFHIEQSKLGVRTVRHLRTFSTGVPTHCSRERR